MGWPVSHSLSPPLHQFWLKKYNLAGSYEPLAIASADLPKALWNLKNQGFCGVNLTVPHKEAACSLVHCLDPTAQRIGAVNLVVIDDQGQLLGRNTDAYGFTQNLQAAAFKDGKVAFVIGAGGACRAILVALNEMGFTKIYLTNRTREKAKMLATQFSTVVCKIDVVDWGRKYDLGDVDLLVNTSSLGMVGQPILNFPLDSLAAKAWVTDIVYTPLRTPLLLDAQKRGHKIVDGLGMLLHQARPSFEAFYGRDPEVNVELRKYVLQAGAA